MMPCLGRIHQEASDFRTCDFADLKYQIAALWLNPQRSVTGGAHERRTGEVRAQGGGVVGGCVRVRELLRAYPTMQATVIAKNRVVAGPDGAKGPGDGASARHARRFRLRQWRPVPFQQVGAVRKSVIVVLGLAKPGEIVTISVTIS